MAGSYAGTFALGGRRGFNKAVVAAMQRAYAGFRLGGPLVSKSRSGNGADVLRVLGPRGMREVPLDMTRFHDLDVVDQRLDGKTVRVAHVPKIELTEVQQIERDRVAAYNKFLLETIELEGIEAVVEFGIGGSGNPKLTNYDTCVEHNLQVLEGRKKSPLYFMMGDKMQASQIRDLARHLAGKKILFVFSSMSGSARDTMSTIVAVLQEMYREADYAKIMREQVVAVTRDSNEYDGRFKYHLKVPANSEARQAKLMYATSTLLLGGDMQKFLDGFEAESRALRGVAEPNRLTQADIFADPNLGLGTFITSQMYLAKTIYMLLGDGRLYPWAPLVKQILGESLGGKMKRGNPFLDQDVLANFIATSPNDFHTELNDYALRNKIAFVAFLMEHADPLALPRGVPQHLVPIGEKFEGQALEDTRNMVNTAVLMDELNNRVPWLAQDLHPELDHRDVWRGRFVARLLLGGTWLPGFALGLRPDTQDGVEGYKAVLDRMDVRRSSVLAYAQDSDIPVHEQPKGGVILG